MTDFERPQQAAKDSSGIDQAKRPVPSHSTDAASGKGSLSRAMGNSGVRRLVEDGAREQQHTLGAGVNPSGSLPDAMRSEMESAFDADFADVRVHQGSSLARELHARAFTQGADIYLAPSESLQRQTGREVLAHELAHVLQARAGRVRTTHREQGRAISDQPELEAEADHISENATRHRQPARSLQAHGPGRSRGAVPLGVGPPLQLFRSLPSGATIVGIQPDMDNIYLACSNLAYRVNSAKGPQVNWPARIGVDLEASLAANRVVPFRDSFTETKGLNFDWEVTILWRINRPEIVGGSSAIGVTRLGGGTVSVDREHSRSSTEHFKGSVTGGGHEGAPGAGVEAGGSATEGRTVSAGVTLPGGVTRRTTERTPTYRAQLVAHIIVTGDAAFSDIDHGNPFKWGYALGTEKRTRSQNNYHAGFIFYQY